MTNDDIPPEILRSEEKAKQPPERSGPSVLGLPGLPEPVIGLILDYGPLIILAAAVLNGFNALGFLLAFTGTGTPQGGSALGAFLQVLASAVLAAAFIPLKQRSRLGWNILAGGLLAYYLANAVMFGVASLLYAGVGLLLTAYVMLQIRDSYTR